MIKIKIGLILFLLFACMSVIAVQDIDSDNDGLLDKYEIIYGTNPQKPDTDGGGVGDGAEVLLDGTNPAEAGDDVNEDQDGDSLTDSEDIILNSSPNLADSDNDGLTDYEELIYHTGSLLKDTDFDGLSDFKEVKETGTDPTLFDTDSDGVSDGAEVLVDATDPKDNNSNVKKDTDNDGLTDSDEARIGTTINNPDTDGDGYKDGDEVMAGYSPLGAGSLKGDTKKINLSPATSGVVKKDLYVVDSPLAEAGSLSLSGSGPANIELNIFLIKSGDIVAQEIVLVDAEGVWRFTSDDLETGSYDVYVISLKKDKTVLAKSLKQSVTLGGVVIDTPEPPVVGGEEPVVSKGGSNTYLIVGLGFVVFAIVLLVVLYFAKRRRDVKPDKINEESGNQDQVASPEVVNKGPLVKPLTELEGFSGNQKTASSPADLPATDNTPKDSVDKQIPNQGQIPKVETVGSANTQPSTQDIKPENVEKKPGEVSGGGVPGNLPIAGDSGNLQNLKDRVK